MILPHELLGVSPDADLVTIKRAFRVCVKEWHPDQSRDPRATARFREVMNAYRSLVRERTHRAQSWRPPSAPRPAPTWSAAVPVEADLAWDDRRSVGEVLTYPARLSRIVLLGTVGAVALFWVSAFLSHL
ncbi:MAG: J domain-containing protein [Polyangiaceae bacterium]